MQKKWYLIMLVALLALSVAPAYAVTWNYYDFGTSVFDASLNNSSPINYPNGIGYLPSPGHQGMGGEYFDIEGINFAYDASFLYVSVTTSYGQSVWSPDWNRFYSEGDLFFGFNGNKYDFAVDVSSGELYDVGLWNYVPVINGGYGGDAGVRTAAGAFSINTGTALGSIDKIYTQYAGLETGYLTPGNGNTYVKEYRISRSLLGDDFESGFVTFHTTIECANDMGEKSFPTIPEPATVVLLGLGLLGAGLARKFRS